MYPHPYKSLSIPNRKPDFVSSYGFEWSIWWDEMIGMHKNSSGHYDEYPYKLAVCPLTGILMYMPPEFYIRWVLFDDRDEEIHAAFKQHIERIILQQPMKKIEQV